MVKNLRAKLARTVCIGAAALALASATEAQPGTSQAPPESYYIFDGKKIPLPVSRNYSALQYRRDLSVKEFHEAASKQAKSLGLHVVQSHPAVRQVWVEGGQKAVKNALKAKGASAKDVIGVEPVFATYGQESTEALVTIPGRIVVFFQEGVGLDQRNELYQRYNLTKFLDLTPGAFSLHTEVPAEEIPAFAIRLMEENPDVVRHAEPVFQTNKVAHRSTALRRSNDPLIERAWHLNNHGYNTKFQLGTVDEDVDAFRAWNPNINGADLPNFGAANPPIVVGVFDDGIDLDHEDWEIDRNNPENAGHLLPPHRTTGETVLITDPRNASIIDPRLGFDVVENDGFPDTGLAEQDGHGTSVAGLIAAAENNGRGLAGVAPGARIVAYRLASNNSYVPNDQIADAIIRAANAQVDIGNHSYGGGSPSEVERAAYLFAQQSGRLGLGMVNFASSSNDFVEMDYPALYRENYSVGATNDQGRRVVYASYGGKLDLVAPSYDFPPQGFVEQLAGLAAGEDHFIYDFVRSPFNPFAGEDRDRSGIASVDIEGQAGYSRFDAFDPLDPNGNYTDNFDELDPGFDEPFGGTSASCPIASGVAAVVMAEHPSLRQDEFFLLLTRTADRPNHPFHYHAFGGTGSQGVDIEPNGWRDLDGFHHEFGYGRVNAYNALANQFAPTPLRENGGTLEKMYELDLPSIFEEITQNGGAGGGTAIALPFFIPSGRLFPLTPGSDFMTIRQVVQQNLKNFEFVFEDGLNQNLPPVLYVLDANPVVNTEPDEVALYNPLGRYRQNSDYEVNVDAGITPATELIGLEVPLVLEVDIKHELGEWNSSYLLVDIFAPDADPVPAGDVVGGGALVREFDWIDLEVNNNRVARLLGDTSDEPGFPPILATGAEADENEIFVATWPEELDPYTPYKSEQQLKFRTYRYFAGTQVFDGPTTIPITVRLSSGASYLPEYDYTQDEFPPPQILEIRRDYTGFQVAGIRLFAGTPKSTRLVDPEAVRLADRGQRPIPAQAQREMLFVGPDLRSVRTQYRDQLVQWITRAGELVEERRNSVPIFSVFEPQVLSLDHDFNSNSLLYTVNGNTNNGRVFLVSEDGIGERRVTSQDAGIREAAFVQGSDTIIMTDGAIISTIEETGTQVDFVFDAASSGLVDMRSISTDPSGAVVFFSAANQEGELDLYGAARVGNRPGRPVIAPRNLLPGWELSIERDARMSPAGQRLAFVSNRRSLADPTAEVIDPNRPYEGFKLYILDNALDVFYYQVTEAPVVQEVLMRRDTTDLDVSAPAFYESAAFPRWSFDNRALFFTGFVGDEDSFDVLNALGEIAYLKAPASLAPEDPLEPPPFTPTATVTPIPTETPGELPTITRTVNYLFEGEADGWEFGAPQPFTAPVASSQGGAVSLVSAGNNSNTFGFWQSPPGAVSLFPLSESAPAPGTLDDRRGPLYLYRAYVRQLGTVDPTQAPGLRIRINSRDVQEFATMEIYSVNGGTAIPSRNTPTVVDLLYEPSPKLLTLDQEFQTIDLSFDLLNFLGDDANSGYSITRIDVFRIPPTALELAQTVANYTFDTNADLAVWDFGAPQDFDAPEGLASGGALSLRVLNPRNTFGFWSLDPAALTAPSAITAAEGLFLRMRSVLSASATNPLDNPIMRLRLSSADFNRTVTRGVVPNATANVTPTNAEARVIYTYFKLPVGSEPVPFLAAWDVLSTRIDLPADAAGQPVRMDEVGLDVVRIKGFPEPATLAN